MKKILTILLMVGVGILLILTLARSNERAGRFECHWPSHIVKSGDTMWMIAGTYCSGNIENAVYHMIELNGGSSLQIGQRVVIPNAS